MIRINLLPVRAAKKKESVRLQLTIAGLVTALFIIVLGLFNMGANSDIKDLETRISTSEKELRTLKAKIGELTKIKDRKRVLENKIRIVSELQQKRTGPVKMFAKIGDAMPENAWITNLRESDRMLVLNGKAAYDDVVADFMRNLETKGIGRVELEVAKRGGRSKRGRGGDDMVSFTIRIVK